MTNPKGRSFLSYRRTRSHEARIAIEAQHDVGIPTWQDLTDLGEGHTETQILEAIADPETANAVCWLTPDLADSKFITRSELPAILKRSQREDGFFVVPVAAGGLAHKDIQAVTGPYLGITDVGQWNVSSVASDPVSCEHAAALARRILKNRVTAISRTLPKGEPLRMVLNTRQKDPPFDPEVALALDWSHRFAGHVVSSPDAWSTHLVPALETVAQACEQHAAGRQIIASGKCALPAAIALGHTFMSTRGISLAWEQQSQVRAPQTWSLRAPRTESGFSATVISADPNEEELALLVSVNSDVQPALGASRSKLQGFRGFVHVTKQGGYPHDIETPGQAVDIVDKIGCALREARVLWPRGKLHLFLAVPAGLAVLIGQTLNSFGPVQTYEHLQVDPIGIYQPAALLIP